MAAVVYRRVKPSNIGQACRAETATCETVFNPAKLWSQARGAVCLLVCAISEVLLVPRTHQLISSKFPGFNYHFAE
jgi:hypothetical protein